jgi:uncharacterized LabA/DUF88 family protein
MVRHWPPRVSARGFFIAQITSHCNNAKMTMKRAMFYVDGFNLYHSIKDLRDEKLKWLSLAQIAQSLIPKKDEKIVGIKYFSALAHKRGLDSIKRHDAYMAFLKSEGVDCILGRFKGQPRKCNSCGNSWKHPEEKETDVNIAIHMVADGYENRYDVCYLISADTDLVPPLQMIKESLPTKTIVAVSPPNRPHGQHIRSIAHRAMKLNKDQIHRCRLPETIEIKGKIINCPVEYM